jgi:hypothetical protein
LNELRSSSASALLFTELSKASSLDWADLVFFNTCPIDYGACSTFSSARGSVFYSANYSVEVDSVGSSFNNSWFGLIHWFPYLFLRLNEVDLANWMKFSSPYLLLVASYWLRMISLSLSLSSYIYA